MGLEVKNQRSRSNFQGSGIEIKSNILWERRGKIIKQRGKANVVRVGDWRAKAIYAKRRFRERNPSCAEIYFEVGVELINSTLVIVNNISSSQALN